MVRVSIINSVRMYVYMCACVACVCVSKAIVPAVITLKFAAVGLGILSDRETVESMSLSGNPRELLGGPLLYGQMVTRLPASNRSLMS